MKLPSIPLRRNDKAEGRGVSDDEVRPPRPPARGIAGYFRRLWSTSPLRRVFWQDMMIVGTAISIVATVAAMALFGLGAPAVLAGAVFVAPVPYTIFLVAAVWRAADRERSEWSWPAKIGALLWLVAVFII